MHLSALLSHFDMQLSDSQTKGAHATRPAWHLLTRTPWMQQILFFRMAFLGFHPFPPIFTNFHSPHVLLSSLIPPHYGSPQCGYFASTFVDLHPAFHAIVKLKINIQMRSMQMKINH